MNYIRYKLRWWKWFWLEMPSLYQLQGCDRETKDILFERWFESEPKPFESEPRP